MSHLGNTHDKVCRELTSAHPIDLTRYQVANCYMGGIVKRDSGRLSVFGYCYRLMLIKAFGLRFECFDINIEFRVGSLSG